MTASTCPADSIGSRTAGLMLLCFTLRELDPVLPGYRRPQPDRQIAFGDAEVLAFEVRQRPDAAALAGDDGVGRLVEQHEDRLHRRGRLVVARTDQRVDVDEGEIARCRRATRAIASDDPPATLVVTARPSALNRPLTLAITKGAAAASIGRSSENWIATGCRGSFGAAAWARLARDHTVPPRPISEARMVRRVSGPVCAHELLPEERDNLPRRLCLFHDTATCQLGAFSGAIVPHLT